MTETSQIRSIGVFHLNQLGDLIFSLPVLEALRAGFPEARITSVVRADLASLLCPSPWLDACITHRGAGEFFSTLRQVRRAEFDLVVCLSQSPRVMLLAAGSGARYRIGFAGGGLSLLLTERVDETTTPSLTANLRLVEALDCRIERRDYRGLLTVEEADRELAEQLLEASGIAAEARLVVVGAAASTRRDEKEWELERFLEVARALTHDEAITVAFIGADPQLGEDLSAERIYDLGGQSSLRSLLALLERADLFLGIDSGPLHLAAAVGTPCVALFGPTDPTLTGPCGDEHTVLYRRHEEGGLGALASAPVVEAVERKLSRS
ncbi:MAG: glycosyltransferase family 9 protein [Thermoanaerobaculia bacterium]|nr:glycosyltransferase family 9 protein [Thermoanaerobaculia bacterium]